MNLTSHFYILYSALFLGGALLAAVFYHYYRHYRTAYLALWTAAFAAMAVAYLATGLTLATIQTLPASHPVRLGASIIAAIGVYLELLWLLLGIRHVTRRLPPTRALLVVATGAVIIGAITLTLIEAFNPESANQRIFWRVTVRAAIIAVAALGTAFVLYRRGRWRTSFGATIVSLSFTVFGLNQLITVAATIYQFVNSRMLPFGASLAVLDTVAQFAIGLGLIIWLLERERSRAHAAGAEAQFHRLHDHLTQLPNRENTAARLSRLIAQSDLRVFQLAVIQLGLDRFKQVNSSFGRWAGDELLRQFSLRVSTLPSTGGFVGRLVSDEFAVVQVLKGGEHEVTRLAERLQRAAREPFLIAEHEVQVDVSIGIALCPRDSEDAELLLKQADLAMQRVKTGGGRGVGFYSPDLDHAARQRYRLEQDLHRALAEDRLMLVFQPIMRSTDAVIVGAEALIRWPHPDRGLLAPDEFLSTAHDAGLMPLVDAWALREALRHAERWRELLAPGFTIAVNTAPETFQSPGLEEMIASALSAHACDHIKLEIEITEQTAIEDLDLTHARIQALGSLGVDVALDDFGIGYSSLGNLQQLKTPIIKLDRAFVGRIPADRDAAVILEAVVPMLQKLGRRIVAEGVQTAAQARFVGQIGVDYQQGFHYHRPMVAADLELLLSRAPAEAGSLAR